MLAIKSVSQAEFLKEPSLALYVLFLIYINHAVSELNCEYKIFADDIKLFLFASENQMTYCVEIMLRNMNKLVRASKSWGLCINIGKCAVMRFCPNNSSDFPSSDTSPYKIDDTFLKFTHSHRDLDIVRPRPRSPPQLKKRPLSVGALYTRQHENGKVPIFELTLQPNHLTYAHENPLK